MKGKAKGLAEAGNASSQVNLDTSRASIWMKYNEFKIMKESSFLINCARGGIVNEKALLNALQSKIIRGAGLDVYDDEPSTSSNPLFSLDNILLSPHIAGVTQEATIRMSKQAVQNILDVFDKKVNPEVIINKNVL